MLQSCLTVGAQGLSTVVCCLHSFPTLGSCLSPTCWWPSCHLFTDGSCEFVSLPLLPSPVCFQQPPPPLLCTSFQFHCLFSFFFLQGGISLSSGALLVYPRGGWEILHDTWLSPVWSAEVLLSMFGACSQQLTAGGGTMGVTSLLFSQCIVSWRSLPWARGSGVPNFQLSLLLHLLQVWLQHLKKVPD
jgi:hypothetical protein